MDLDKHVRALLIARKGEWQSIATNASVSHSWLSKFVRGKIDNPGYQTLKKIEAAIKS